MQVVRTDSRWPVITHNETILAARHEFRAGRVLGVKEHPAVAQNRLVCADTVVMGNVAGVTFRDRLGDNTEAPIEPWLPRIVATGKILTRLQDPNLG